jgi:DHA1 family bicyclomycin/chloramphenicol resistance-like MFS transporter
MQNLTMVVLLLMIVIGSLGIIAPNNMSCYMHSFARNSGAANAIMGSFQFAFGAFVGLIVSYLHDGTPFPMFSVILISSLFGFVSFSLRK